MKKYEVKELFEAIKLLDVAEKINTNSVISDFKKSVEAEYRKRNAPKFIKATDAYLNKLKVEDTYIRYLKETDEHYYPGMQGLFERKTNKLLRRHTDTGFLSVAKHEHG